ncbi:MAG TPA: hypothetical protein VGJ48_24490 [Pyrinomonadaceae bacterium]|jgi:hypothetical protein
MEASLTYQAFAQHIHTKFQVPVDDSQRVELELAEISELKESPGHEEFALVFRGPCDAFLGQGTRSFEHDQMGQFGLFIVPIRQDEQGYYYEAVFNRFRQ